MHESQLRSMVGSNEQILWSGKPNMKCFILESIFNPMLISALTWPIISYMFMGDAVSSANITMFSMFFVICAFAPVLLYLGGVIASIIKHINTEYIITDRAIYISGGIFTYMTEMKPLADLSQVNIHRGIFDQFIGVGDVITVCSHNSMTSQYSTPSNSDQGYSHGLNICDIEDYEYVFELIRNIQTDLYSDMMYPNALRPEENSGYETRYTGSYEGNTNRNSSMLDDDRF